MNSTSSGKLNQYSFQRAYASLARVRMVEIPQPIYSRCREISPNSAAANTWQVFRYERCATAEICNNVVVDLVSEPRLRLMSVLIQSGLSQRKPAERGHNIRKARDAVPA